MTRRCLAALVLLVLTAGAAAAQDARSVLQAASTAMGAATLKTIEITGNGGFVAGTGHSFTTRDDWPRSQIVSYTRTIDYDARTSREDISSRTTGDYRDYGGRYDTFYDPPRAGLGPRQGRAISVVSGDFAWTEDAKGTARAPFRGYLYSKMPQAELGQLDIILTPHGFLKAAMAAGNATATTLPVAGPAGGKVTIVSFTAFGKYRINGTINSQNLVEAVQTWIPNPVVGDLLYETVMSDYKDFGGVKYPAVMRFHQGDARFDRGQNAKEVRVSAVKANVAAPAVKLPNLDWKGTLVVFDKAESIKVGDGVWQITGGTHFSVAMEFRDFAVVVEAPMNEVRSLAVIAEVQRLMPNKPIRYMVQPHHHWEHAGGMRTYSAIGTTIVGHEGNRAFYENVVLSATPRMMEPDILSSMVPLSGRRPKVETTSSKYVISDGFRAMEVYAADGFSHGGEMLLVYIPHEKIIVNSDLYSPTYFRGGEIIEVKPTHAMVELQQAIERLKLDVGRHVAMHGRIGTQEEFLKVLASGTPGDDDY